MAGIVMSQSNESEEITDLEKNAQALSQVVSRMLRLQFGYDRKQSPNEALQNLQELQRTLAESSVIVRRISDPRATAILEKHEKYLQRVNPMLDEVIKNRISVSPFWGSARFQKEFPLEVLTKLIPENSKLLLAILRLPKDSKPYVFSLQFEKEAEADELVQSLAAIENTKELSRVKKGGGILAGSAGPLVFDPVIVVTLISVVANIATLSDVIRKYLKQDKKVSSRAQLTIKTQKGEVILNNLPSKEIDRILHGFFHSVGTDDTNISTKDVIRFNLHHVTNRSNSKD